MRLEEPEREREKKIDEATVDRNQRDKNSPDFWDTQRVVAEEHSLPSARIPFPYMRKAWSIIAISFLRPLNSSNKWTLGRLDPLDKIDRPVKHRKELNDSARFVSWVASLVRHGANAKYSRFS